MLTLARRDLGDHDGAGVHAAGRRSPLGPLGVPISESIDENKGRRFRRSREIFLHGVG